MLASISDQNIPVQPDGNTQQLQDFDQVYIQLFSDRTKLTAGDYQIRSSNSYFMRYNKRLRGGDVEANFETPRNGTTIKNKLQASAAVSRGKFARNVFNGLEGNQGPYRLVGDENESFIIVLSGTEAVYIDGKLLKRGQENDYVVDYNNAEITFTANQPITKDKRIVVEFQYSAQAFSRSLVRFSDELDFGRLKLNVNAYSEQDAKNQPLQQDLNEEQKQTLEQIGNNVDNAFATGVTQVSFEDDRVLYKKVFDTIAGVVDSHYVYSTNPDSALYQLSFSDVGIGNGNYVQIQSNANGKVYEYIPAINGVRQGRYEPIVLLVTPKKRQMFTLGGSYQLSDNSTADFEFAYSNRDLNTFSEVGNSANQGTGVKFNIRSNKKLGEASRWKLISDVGLEHVSKNFQAIERFRKVEFERDWNLTNVTLVDDQILPTVSVGIEKGSKLKANYLFKSFLSGTEYRGFNNGVNIVSQFEKSEFSYAGNMLNVDATAQSSTFYRHDTKGVKKAKYFEVGFKDIYENNQFRNKETDSLSLASYEFWEWEAFVQNPSAQKNRLKVGYVNRFDRRGKDNRLKDATFGESVNLEMAWLKNRAIKVKGKTTYRKLRVQDTTLYDGQPEENVTSRIEYSLKLAKGALSVNSFYEVGSGLEEKREFVYVEVDAGLGQYVWIDENDNGIKELNEFQPKKFDNEGNYIKVSTQTNDFIRTYSNQFSQSLFVEPKRFWRGNPKGNTGVRHILGKVSNQSTYRVDRKTEEEDELERFNPFTRSVEDSSIVSVNASFRNVLYFNRAHPKVGLEWTFQQVQNKIETFNGTEARENVYTTWGLRYNFTRAYIFNLNYTKGNSTNDQELFETNDFDIDYQTVEPKFTYQADVNWKMSVNYGFTNKSNGTLEGGEEVEIHKVGLEMQLSKIGKGIVKVGADVLDITYNGVSNTTLAYEMLDGLQPGKNGVWNVIFQRSLGKNLQLNLNYNGRITEISDIVHAGSVQIRAFF